MKHVSIFVVRSLFTYDAASGLVTRKVTTGGALAGALAGSVRRDGYLSVGVKGREVLAHRLSWALHFGEWPPSEIDHINGNRADNAIANLRCVDRTTNNQNKRRAYSNNELGVLGVRVVPSGRFIARIRVSGRLVRLGTFDSMAQASDAYAAAKRALHAGASQ